jgi:hypothetical protein
MNEKSPPPTPQVSTLAVVGVGLAIIVVAGLLRFRGSPSGATAATGEITASSPIAVSAFDSARVQDAIVSAPTSSAALAAAPVRRVESVSESPETLVAKVTSIATAEVTPATAALLRQTLDGLKASGFEAFPAIRDFLAKNQDIPFGNRDVATAIGQPSLRLAFLNVLEEIGGPEAINVAAEVLGTTGDPLEIARLSGFLEKSAPGQFREEALKAAGEALKFAREGQLQGQRIAPAFEVLQTFGDANVIPVLEQAFRSWLSSPEIRILLPAAQGTSSFARLHKRPSDRPRPCRLSLTQLAPIRFGPAHGLLSSQRSRGSITSRTGTCCRIPHPLGPISMQWSPSVWPCWI